MGVVRGEDWGAVGPVPDDALSASSDGQLADLVVGLLRDPTGGGEPAGPTVMLAGGDLCRTLGGRGQVQPGSEATLVDVDVGEALLDGRLHRFVAHLIIRPTRHPGRWWVAANAAHRGGWNVAPRAHPGDGLLDVLDASVPLREVPAAWRRLGRGLHVPHPAIRQQRSAAIQMSFDRPVPVRVDGRPVGRVRELSIRVQPGALRLAI